jgi:hypothetical protein
VCVADRVFDVGDLPLESPRLFFDSKGLVECVGDSGFLVKERIDAMLELRRREEERERSLSARSHALPKQAKDTILSSHTKAKGKKQAAIEFPTQTDFKIGEDSSTEPDTSQRLLDPSSSLPHPITTPSTAGVGTTALAPPASSSSSASTVPRPSSPPAAYYDLDDDSTIELPPFPSSQKYPSFTGVLSTGSVPIYFPFHTAPSTKQAYPHSFLAPSTSPSYPTGARPKSPLTVFLSSLTSPSSTSTAASTASHAAPTVSTTPASGSASSSSAAAAGQSYTLQQLRIRLVKKPPPVVKYSLTEQQSREDAEYLLEKSEAFRANFGGTAVMTRLDPSSIYYQNQIYWVGDLVTVEPTAGSAKFTGIVEKFTDDGVCSLLYLFSYRLLPHYFSLDGGRDSRRSETSRDAEARKKAASYSFRILKPINNVSV